MDGCLDRALILVSAPAGFGKTTLVSTWVQGLRQPVAWLSLEEADNDPVRFLRYLTAALQRIDATVGRDVYGALEATPPPPVASAVSALINDLSALPDDFLVVLDDFQVIDDATVHEAIQELATHQPPQTHLVISTREDPPLPLARLRAHGQLIELRASDLRFTIEEASVFLRDVMGLALEPQDIQDLDARIEGWIGGLQLAALSLQGREKTAEIIATLSGSHHFILSYLTEEVLNQQSPDVQSFLLQTSVLDRLTGALCDALAGRDDSATMLEELYTSNVFVIPLDDEHCWYRYHPLFADLLRNQLSRTRPEMASTLHQRASAWYERHGGAAEAIGHAFAAGDHGHVVRLLEVHARPIVAQGYVRTVEDWLRRLPPEWRDTGPRANLAFAWSPLLRGQLAEVEPYLHHAEAAVAEHGQSDAGSTAESILAESQAMRAVLISPQGDPERGCQLAQEALEQVPPDDVQVQGLALFALGTALNYAGKAIEAVDACRKALPLCQTSGNTAASMMIVANLALLHIVRGQLSAAADLCLQVIQAIERPPRSRSPAMATAYGNYGDVLYAWDRLDEAHRQIDGGLDLSKRGGHVAAVAYGSALLSRILQARGDISGAEEALNQAVELLHRSMPAWVTASVVSQQVALALARDDHAAASYLLAQTSVSTDDKTNHTREVIHIAYLRLLLQLGRDETTAPHLDQALSLAARVLESAEPASRLGRVIETLVLRVLIHHARGDAKPALEDLGRALALAEPEGYVGVFVDEGIPMARLLRALRERGMQPAYVSKLLAAFPSEASDGSPPRSGLAEPLTECELEVLRLIVNGLTYEEIAQQLVVSPNTVRFHVKGLYGKLGVNSRTLAVGRARALRLF